MFKKDRNDSHLKFSKRKKEIITTIFLILYVHVPLT